MNAELAPKRLGLLHELVPRAKRFGALLNVDDPINRVPLPDLQARGADIGLAIEPFYLRSDRDIDLAFASLQERRTEALLVFPSALLFNRRVQVLTLAARHLAPIIYPAREWAMESDVFEDWRTSPFTRHSILRLSPSARSAVTSQGSTGADPSRLLPSIHWVERDCRSRAVKSLPVA